MVKKLILDMDPGIDDALALMAACSLDSVEILGVSVVGGNLPLETVAANASGILLQMGSSAQVYKGASGPLYGKLADAADIHGSGGLGNWQVRSDPPRISSRHAAEFIAGAAHAHPGEVTLVATGPLTNLAIALEYHPRDLQNLAGVVFMGGALTVPGNVTPAAEFNIYTDPDAAEVVLNSDLQLTMVGLDVTQQVCFDEGDLRKLAAGGGNSTAVSAMSSYYIEKHGQMPLHDPLALLAALKPDFFTFRTLPLVIETRGAFCRGQTIADFSGEQNWNKVRVAWQADKDRCKEYLMSLWAR